MDKLKDMLGSVTDSITNSDVVQWAQQAVSNLGNDIWNQFQQVKEALPWAINNSVENLKSTVNTLAEYVPDSLKPKGVVKDAINLWTSITQDALKGNIMGENTVNAVLDSNTADGIKLLSQAAVNYNPVSFITGVKPTGAYKNMMYDDFGIDLYEDKNNEVKKEVKTNSIKNLGLRDDDVELAELSKDVSAWDMGSGIFFGLKDIALDFFTDQWIEKYLNNGISKKDFESRVFELNQKIKEASEAMNAISSDPKHALINDFNTRVEKEFRDLNALQGQEVNMEEFKKFQEQKFKELPLKDQIAIQQANEEYMKDVAPLSMALDMRNKDYKEYINNSIKAENESGEQVLERLQKEWESKINDSKYLKSLSKINTAARSDLEKSLSSYTLNLKDYSSFQSLEENIDNGSEVLTSTRKYISEVANLELNDEEKKRIIWEMYKMYDVEKRVVAEYIAKRGSKFFNEMYPSSKFNKDELNKIALREIQDSLSPQEKEMFNKITALKAKVEWQVNINELKKRRDEWSQNYLLQALDVTGIAGWFIAGGVTEQFNKDTSYTARTFEAWGRLGGKIANIAPGISESEFERIAARDGLSQWKTYLDPALRSAMGPLLRSGVSGFDKVQELIASNMVPIAASLGTGWVPSLSAKVAAKWTKLTSQALGEVGETVLKASSFAEKVVSSSKPAQNLKYVIDAKLTGKVGFDTVQLPAVIKTASGKIGKGAEWAIELKNKAVVLGNSAANTRVWSYADNALQSLVGTSITDPYFNAISGDAPTAALQGFNALTGMFFETIPLGIHDIYRKSKTWSFVEWKENMFSSAINNVNDTFNNITFAFMSGDKKTAIRDLQAAYNKELKINIDAAEATRVLEQGEQVYKNLYNVDVVNSILKNKWELYAMLSKNIPEMGKANMTTLLTGSGIGIKLHNPNAQIAEELQNLRLLKQDIENPNTPDINKKSSMLKSSRILDTIENFVTGKGRLDNAFIEKAFRTPENIEKNKTVFQHYRKQIENAKTMDDFEEAVQELDAYVYKIQSQQGSTKRKHLITLMNGANMKDSSAYFNITVDNLAELADKNIDDLLAEWKVTIGENNMGLTPWIYNVATNSRIETTIMNIINSNDEIIQMIDDFKKDIKNWAFAGVKISERYFDQLFLNLLSGEKARINLEWINENFTNAISDITLKAARIIFPDAEINAVQLPKTSIEEIQAGMGKMDSTKQIIEAMQKSDSDFVIATGTYENKKWDVSTPRTAVYFSLGWRIVNDEWLKPHINKIQIESEKSLTTYIQKTRAVMSNMFTLWETSIGVSIEKGKRLMNALYDSLGNPILDGQQIRNHIVEITQDAKAANFIISFMTKNNAANQSQMWLLAINLAYAYQIHKDLIDELVKRAKTSGKTDQFNEMFSKILLGNTVEIYKKIYGDNYNVNRPSPKILEAYKKARAEYIQRYKFQKENIEIEIKALQKERSESKSLLVRRALDKTIKENERRIKNIDKIIRKVGTFKKDFIRDLATQGVVDQLTKYAKATSFNFLFRDSSNLVDQKFIKGLTQPSIEFKPETNSEINASVNNNENIDQQIIEEASTPTANEVTEDVVMQDMFTKLIQNISSISNNQDRNKLYDYLIKFTESPSLGTKRDLQEEANAFYDKKIASFNSNPKKAEYYQNILDTLNSMMNELYIREAKLNNLDTLVEEVYNSSNAAYSRAYLDSNPLMLNSLKKAFTFSGPWDDRVAEAFRKELWIPDGIINNVDFVDFINSSEWAEVRAKFESLIAYNEGEKVIYPNTKWLVSAISKSVKDISIDTFDGAKRQSVTKELTKQLINSNELADLVKSMKAVLRLKHYDNVVSEEEYIEPLLKIDRMLESGMNVRFYKPDSMSREQIEKYEAGVVKSGKSWQVDVSLEVLGFGDKDTYFQTYTPPVKFPAKWADEDIQNIGLDIYEIEYAYAEWFFIWTPDKKEDLLKTINAIDSSKLTPKKYQEAIDAAKVKHNFKPTKQASVTKREASQMSNYSVFDKIDKKVQAFVFVEKAASKDDLPVIEIDNDKGYRSNITLTPDQRRYIENAINTASSIEEAYANVNHYIENALARTQEDWYSVMSGPLIDLRDKTSTYKKWRSETKDHMLGKISNDQSKDFAVMAKTNFTKWKIRVFDESSKSFKFQSYAVAIGENSLKMGWDNMIPYSQSIPNYQPWMGPKVEINEKMYELKYPPFDISTQDFKNASSDTSRKKESASTGASIIAKLPYELAREVAIYQDKLIKDAWEKTIGHLLSGTVEVNGFSDVLKAMQKVREYTGQIWDGHSSIIKSKLDAFMSELNDIMSKMRVDSGSAVIRKVDNEALNDAEILLSKEHPVVRKALENVDNYIANEAVRRSELNLEPLSDEDIQKYKEEQLVTTMHRFPTPSMYNLGIYRIRILEEELAWKNAELFKEYEQMWGNQVVMTSVPAYLKMEGDFDGDKVYFVPLVSEIGKVFGKALLETNDIPVDQSVARFAINQIASGDYYNKYVITKQVDDIDATKKPAKPEKTETASGVRINKIIWLRKAAMIGKKAIGEVASMYRTLGLLQQEKEMILAKDPNYFNKNINDPRFNLLKSINIRNNKLLDSEMMSFLQITLDFAKTGRTEFDMSPLDDIVSMAFGNKELLPTEKEFLKKASMYWSTVFPLDSYKLSAWTKSKDYTASQKEAKKKILAGTSQYEFGMAFRLLNTVKVKYGSYLAILSGNNESKIFNRILNKNEYSDLKALHDPFVYTSWQYTVQMPAVAIKQAVSKTKGKKALEINFGEIPTIKLLWSFNSAFLEKIQTWKIDGIELTEEQVKYYTDTLNELRKELFGYAKTLASLKSSYQNIDDVKFSVDLTKYPAPFPLSPHDKLILGTIANVYGEKYMMDFYSGNDIVRYITDTHTSGVTSIDNVLSKMKEDGFTVWDELTETLKSISIHSLLPDELKILKDAKAWKLQQQIELKQTIESIPPTAEQQATLRQINEDIAESEKDLSEIETLSDVIKLKDKAIKTDDSELLSLYSSISENIENGESPTNAVDEATTLANFNKEEEAKLRVEGTIPPAQAENLDSNEVGLDEIMEFDQEKISDFEIQVKTPVFIPSIPNTKLMVTVESWEEKKLVDEMLSQAGDIDTLYKNGFNLVTRNLFAKYLPDFYDLYRSIDSYLTNHPANIGVAQEYSVSEFSVGPTKNIYSFLKWVGVAHSDMPNYMEAIQSALLRKEKWVYTKRDLVVALEELKKDASETGSSTSRIISLLEDPDFQKRLTDYQDNVIVPVATALNGIQRKYFDPAGDAYRGGNSIGAKYEADPKVTFKLVEDVLQAQKWDPQFARILLGMYNEADVETAIRKKSDELGNNGNIKDGTVRAMKAELFQPKFGTVTTTIINGISWMQAFAYSTKYGFISTFTGNWFIAGVSQMIPNYIELRAYQKAYTKDLSLAYKLLDEGILASEDVMQFSTGNLKDINENRFSQETGRWIKKIGSASTNVVLSVVEQASKLAGSRLANNINKGVIAKKAGEFLHMFSTNMLGAADMPLEKMRKAVAIQSTLRRFGINNMQEFENAYSRWGQAFLNKIEWEASRQFAVSGGGVVSKSSINRWTIFDNFWHYLPESIQPVGYILSKMFNFLLGWANNKAANVLENSLHLVTGLNLIRQGKRKEWMAHLQASADFVYMVMSQAAMVTALYMQTQKREKDPNDLQTAEEFFFDFSNIGVVYEMLVGKWIELDNVQDRLDPNASIEDQAKWLMFNYIKQQTRVFNVDVIIKAYKHYDNQNALVWTTVDAKPVTMLEAIQWALDDSYAAASRITNAKLADEFYAQANQSNTAMLLTEGASIMDDMWNLMSEKSYISFSNKDFPTNITNLMLSYLGLSEGWMPIDGITASVTNKLMTLTEKDQELNKLYTGKQISAMPWDYNLSNLIGNAWEKITEQTSKNIDEVYKYIQYDSFGDGKVDNKWNRTGASAKYESGLDYMVNKKFEDYAKANGINLEAVIAGSPHSPDVVRMQAQMEAKMDISTPVFLAWKIKRQYEVAKNNFKSNPANKKYLKKWELGWDEISPEIEAELKRWVLLTNQVSLNLSVPVVQKIADLHIRNKHSKTIEALNETLSNNKEHPAIKNMIGNVEAHILMNRNITEAKGVTNLPQLQSKFALSMRTVQDGEIAANLVINKLRDIESLPIDKKEKLTMQAAALYALNKSQFSILEKRPEFDKLSKEAQRTLISWSYKVATDAEDFDSNSMGRRLNDTAYGYSGSRARYAKSFAKTPYRKSWSALNSGVGGQRPNFSKQFQNLNDYVAGKEDMLPKNFREKLNQEQYLHNANQPQLAGQQSKYRAAYNKYQVEAMFYGYDSKGSLSPFIERPKIKWPIIQELRMKRKSKKPKNFNK